jgi:sirohydrochlorin ferrochelatase
VIPYFLTLGTHMQRDLPKLVTAASAAHDNIPMQITSPLDGHPALLDALLDRAKEALAQ